MLLKATELLQLVHLLFGTSAFYDWSVVWCYTLICFSETQYLNRGMAYSQNLNINIYNLAGSLIVRKRMVVIMENNIYQRCLHLSDVYVSILLRVQPIIFIFLQKNLYRLVVNEWKKKKIHIGYCFVSRIKRSVKRQLQCGLSSLSYVSPTQK